jgi:hypothetical protein
MQSERDTSPSEDEQCGDIPAVELPLLKSGEAIVPISDEPPKLPAGKTIHKRPGLPQVPKGPNRDARSDSPPIVIRERQL